MKRKDIISRIYKESEVIANTLNYDLVDVEYIKEFGSYYLRVYIDKTGGVSLDDCQIMSEKISGFLDSKDLIIDSYYLEVSSPGLDRPLKSDKDLQRNIGKEVEISLYKALDGRKKYDGKFLDFTKNDIIISLNKDSTISISREYISLIKLKVNF